MDLIKIIRKTFSDCIEENKIFTYDAENLKAVGILNGLKHTRLKDLKDLLRKNGYNYSYVYECYILNSNSINNFKEYRNEKDKFIDNLISWKFCQNNVCDNEIINTNEQIRN